MSELPSGAEPVESGGVDELPFSLITELFRDLRLLNEKRKRSHFGARKVLALEKRQLLERFWLYVAENTCYGRKRLAEKSNEAVHPAYYLAVDDAFKIICFLVPTLDNQHPIFGMRDKLLADAFIKALDLPDKGADAQWLRNYKDNTYRTDAFKLAEDVQDGSLPSVLRAVVRDRCEEVSQLTIGTVWSALDILSEVGDNANSSRYKTPNYGGPKSVKAYVNIPKSEMQKRLFALKEILRVGTCDDVAEFSRLILKDTETKVSDDWFFNWFHPDAKQHYNQTHDLQRLLSDCHDPTFKIGEFAVKLGWYASVMLTQRPSRKNLKTICKSLIGVGDGKGIASMQYTQRTQGTQTSKNSVSDKYYLVEPKFDGERMQLHFIKESDDTVDKSAKVQTFARSGKESSENYAKVLTDVSAKSIRAHSAILDGEIMIWDELRSNWVPFENIRHVLKRINEDDFLDDVNFVVKFMVFDVMYCCQNRNGKLTPNPHKIVRYPLHKRKEILAGIVVPEELPYRPGIKAKIEIVEADRSCNEDELLSSMRRMVHLGYEGVIAKNPDQPYVFGERRPDVAIKLKPDYFDGGLKDLDVVILGARFSTSTKRVGRAGDLSTFLIGVRDDQDHDPNDGKWIPIGAVGTGYSDNDLKEIRAKLDGYWEDLDQKNLPSHFSERDYSPTIFTNVQKWIPPNQSIVVKVLAYELSMKHYALRFPRVEAIRWDKEPYQANSMNDLIELNEAKAIPYVRANKDDEDDDGDDYDLDGFTSRKRRKTKAEEEEEIAIAKARAEGVRITGGISSRKVVGSARAVDMSQVEVVSSCLENIVFHVISDDREEKAAAEIKVHELGGKLVQTLSESVDYVVGLGGPRLASRLEEFKKNPTAPHVSPILKMGWLHRCRAQKQKVKLVWRDVLFAPPELEEELEKVSDRFGDPWEEDITADNLLQCVENVFTCTRDDRDAGLGRVDESKIPSLDNAMKKGGCTFAGQTFFVPKDMEIIPRGAAVLVETMGGKLASELSAQCCILIHSSCEEEWKSQQAKSEQYSSCRVVTDAWVRKEFQLTFTDR